MGKEALQLLHFGLNQDHGCLHCALSTGFRVFNCDPYQEKVPCCSYMLNNKSVPCVIKATSGFHTSNVPDLHRQLVDQSQSCR